MVIYLAAVYKNILTDLEGCVIFILPLNRVIIFNLALKKNSEAFIKLNASFFFEKGSI